MLASSVLARSTSLVIESVLHLIYAKAVGARSMLQVASALARMLDAAGILVRIIPPAGGSADQIRHEIDN